ncbi:MAG: NRDE family protein [Pseudomonadales bacterium]|nr:NRDE family protein [Pseudomonadales bacterium]
MPRPPANDNGLIMCLLVVAWQAHPRYRLIAAANRDEFHARPAAALARWSDAPQIAGGRDLQAGGTWLAVSRAGNFGVVTNYREMQRSRASAPSRGGLIPGYLQGSRLAPGYLADLETDAVGYAGFSLLLADEATLWYASNRTDDFARPLDRGIFGLSNHTLDTPWPKVERLRSRFAATLAATDAPAPSTLFELLADRTPAANDSGVATGLTPDWERALSSPFVQHESYGTRCSTVVMIGHDSVTRIIERRFDRDGQLAGETELTLNPARDP